jgi:predicted NBD/HSP70 family sugar kinase
MSSPSAKRAGRSVDGSGAILALVRHGQAHTPAQLTAVTGLSRTAVTQRIEALLAAGFLVVDGLDPSTGGRRSRRLRFNSACGTVLAADLGPTHARLAVADLGGRILAERAGAIDIAAGPVPVLEWVVGGFGELLAEARQDARGIRGVGVGIPDPVESATGRPARTTVMLGWDDFPIADHLRERFGAPVLVEKDVNVMTLGEAFSRRAADDHLLVLKVASGIGLGYLAGGVLLRGAQGAFGDIGHIALPDHEDVICPCGGRGCVEAVAGAEAVAARLSAAGVAAADARDVMEHVRAGVPEAVRITREAGRQIGTVLALVVNVMNPASIVVCGEMADPGGLLIAGVRELVYQRSTALATQTLQFSLSAAGDRAGVIGATALAVEHVLSPAVVDREVVP